jgi:rsbT co-antagonist protein RsbR
MFVRLRTRLLVSSLVTVGLVIGLLSFILLERVNLNARIDQLVQITSGAGLARELSLYVQYNAHDTNAYLLGHLEHRQEFAEHAQAFGATVDQLQERISAGILEEDEQTALDQIAQLRAAYTRTSEDLFAAADVNRASPSIDNQGRLDQAWETAEQLENQLDSASQELASQINADAQRLEQDLADRNRQLVAWALGLGLTIVGLIVVLQSVGARAVGAPVQALLAGVRNFADGKLDARVAVTRADEIGTLASAFNTMATTIEQQTDNLQLQSEEALVARREAERAHHEVAQQLAQLEQQRAVIRDMSVPILPISATTLVMPLVGSLDHSRLNLLQEQALRAIEQTHVQYLIVDITGVPLVDTEVAHGLLQVVRAARLLGTDVVLVGIRPEVAQAVVGLGLHLGHVLTRSTLQSGIAMTLGHG